MVMRMLAAAATGNSMPTATARRKVESRVESHVESHVESQVQEVQERGVQVEEVEVIVPIRMNTPG
jgi:hypothetical protein